MKYIINILKISLSYNLIFFSMNNYAFDILNAPTECKVQTNDFLNVIQKISDEVSEYKSDWELELYRRKYGHCIKANERDLACYKDIYYRKKRCFDEKEKKHTLMKKEKLVLNQMASIFNVPKQLLFCTYFVESRFKPFAESSSGATGIAQFLDKTVNTLKVVYTRPLQKTIDYQPNDCNKYKTWKDINYCNKIKERIEYSKKWDQAEKYLISQDIINESMPIKCNLKGAYCGITLGASLYHYHYNDIKRRFPKLILPINDFETLQMLMPTYNAGHGVIFNSDRVQALQNCQKNNRLIKGCVLKKLEEKYNSNPTKYGYLKEPIGYAKGISNCIKKDNYDPPVKGEVSLSCK